MMLLLKTDCIVEGIHYLRRTMIPPEWDGRHFAGR